MALAVAEPHGVLLVSAPRIPSSSRLGWIDFSKGICIIGVVTLYAVQKMHDELGLTGWMQLWVDFARPFRMPDFFLLSGLFLARVIDRPWRGYLDKKVVHYLYYYVLWTFIYFLGKAAVGRAGHTFSEMAFELGFMLVEPFAMLWFIAILPVFFIITRLTRKVPWWVMLPLGVALQVSDFHTDAWLMIGHFCERFVFFYIGYRFAALFFHVAQRTDDNPRGAAAVLAVWAVAHGWLVAIGIGDAPGWSLLVGLVGCMAVIVAGALLQRVQWMDWLRWLGEHSIVTYLAFFLPMGLLIVVMKRTGPWLDPGTTAAALSVVSTALAVLLYRATAGTRLGFLFERPGWAHLRAPRNAAEEARSRPLHS
jgi:uncharacterized membrane protein YcfT